MVEVLIDSIRDTIRVVPVLFIVFLSIDFILLKVNRDNRLTERLSKYDYVGGSILGIIPQCGISVAMAKLYSNGYITLGMLAAVFLASSDEALIIIGAHPDKLAFMACLILVKVAIAMAAGFLINTFIKEKRNRLRVCGAGCDCPLCRRHSNIFLHNILYTLKLTVFLAITVFVINMGVERLGQESFDVLLARNSFLQPIFAALVGMVPSCVSSVVLAEGYIRGAVGLGSLVSGLCANTGYGILVILKELPVKKSIKIVLLLQAISIAAGEAVYLFSR